MELKRKIKVIDKHAEVVSSYPGQIAELNAARLDLKNSGQLYWTFYLKVQGDEIHVQKHTAK